MRVVEDEFVTGDERGLVEASGGDDDLIRWITVKCARKAVGFKRYFRAQRQDYQAFLLGGPQ